MEVYILNVSRCTNNRPVNGQWPCNVQTAGVWLTHCLVYNCYLLRMFIVRFSVIGCTASFWHFLSLHFRLPLFCSELHNHSNNPCYLFLLYDLETLICAPVVRPKQCPTSLNPAFYQTERWSVSASLCRWCCYCLTGVRLIYTTTTTTTTRDVSFRQKI